jgi:hypothetical protein
MILLWCKNALSYYNAGVLAENLKVVGLAPGSPASRPALQYLVPKSVHPLQGLLLRLANDHNALDHGPWKPEYARSWALKTTIRSIMGPENQNTLDHGPWKLEYAWSWALKTRIRLIMGPENLNTLDHGPWKPEYAWSWVSRQGSIASKGERTVKVQGEQIEWILYM